MCDLKYCAGQIIRYLVNVIVIKSMLYSASKIYESAPHFWIQIFFL